MTETETVPDIVERLRVWPAAYGEDAMSSTYVGKMAKTAADEIEELRHRLEWQADKLSEQDDELQYSRSRLAQTPGLTKEPFIISDDDWQRALDCAMSCLRPEWTKASDISRIEMDNAMQHAFGILSLVYEGRRGASPDTSPDRTSK